MKKQLLIAAVAATMTSVAMADISITGAAKVNYTTTDFDNAATLNSNKASHEMDLKVLGKSGDTTVVINFGSIDTLTTATGDNVSDTAMNIEDAYVASSVAGISVKAGQWDNGNNALRASSRNDGKVELGTEFSGVKVTYGTENESVKFDTQMVDYIKVAADFSGVAVSYKDVHTGEDISVSTTMGGVKASYLALNRDTANTDRSVVELSGSVGGVDIKVAQASADSATTISGDTWMGDFEGATGSYLLTNGQDVTSISLKTTMAGNTVEFINSKIDDGAATTDTSFNKIIVTRPLASGTTFEATYTMLDDDDTSNLDSDSLDLELAVKF